MAEAMTALLVCYALALTGGAFMYWLVNKLLEWSEVVVDDGWEGY